MILPTLIFCGCARRDADNDNIPVSQNEEKPPETEKPSPPDAESLTHYNDYNVNIDVSPENGKVSVIEKIDYKNTTGKPLDEIYINAYANAFTESCEYEPYDESVLDDIFPNGKEYASFNITSFSINNEDTAYSLNNTLLNAKLKKSLPAGETAVITLRFEAYIPKMAYIIGRNDNAMWFGNLIPTLAMRDGDKWIKSYYYPTGDSVYADIANYNVNISAPDGYSVVTSGGNATKSELSESAGKRTFFYNARLIRSFAVALSNVYKRESIETKDGLTINLYHYEDAPQAAKALLESAKKSMEYYADNVGSYPYNQLNIAETDYFNGMDCQNPNLIYVDDWILVEPTEEKFNLIEFGLQWFGNIVGIDKTVEAWLAEGASVFLQNYINCKGSLEERMDALYAQVEKKIPNVEHPELNNTLAAYESWEDYATAQKQKAALMFYALYKEMGEEDFKDFILDYCSYCSFKNVTSSQIIDFADKFKDKDLKEFFDKWLKDKGLPKI